MGRSFVLGNLQKFLQRASRLPLIELGEIVDGAEMEQVRQLGEIQILLLDVILDPADDAPPVILHNAVPGDLPEHFFQLRLADVEMVYHICKIDVIVEILVEKSDDLPNDLIFISKGTQRQGLHFRRAVPLLSIQRQEQLFQKICDSSP